MASKKVLIIEAERHCYSLSECANCSNIMTAKQFKEYLDENVDDDAVIVISNDSGYTYGRVREEALTIDNVEDEENDG